MLAESNTSSHSKQKVFEAWNLTVPAVNEILQVSDAEHLHSDSY